MQSQPGWDRQTKLNKDSPYAWIQWKGTSVCMDLHCLCGTLTHFDQDFTYYVRCSNCQQIYMANGHIEMVPLTVIESEVVMDQVKDGD